MRWQSHSWGMLDRCRDHRCLTKVINNTDNTVPLIGGSKTHVGTTDVSLPVKNNTDRMNQLVR